MTAAELIAAIGTLPPARKLPAAAPIAAAVEVAGIEVATTGDLPEPRLRRAWRERHRGAAPLVLLTDGGDSALTALGPADADGPLRQVDSRALEVVLRRISTLPRLEAVRELAAELERLDQAGIPGLRLRDLLTLHTLDVRLRNNTTRWSEATELAGRVAAAGDWRALVTGFGYSVERRQLRGHLLRFSGRPVAVVHPKADPSEFAKLDADGRPPEGVLLNDCDAENVTYGLLASGARLRLFDFSRGAGTTSRYIDLDASALRPDDRPLLALVAPPYLAESGFAALVAEAAAFGAALRKRLDERIRQGAFPALARGMEAWARSEGLDLGDPDVLEELEKAALTLLFRLLFLLFAESSRYLPMDNRAYEQASVTALVREAAELRPRLGARSTSFWDRIQVLVRAMRTGNPAWRVPAYNGALFAGDGFEGARTLERMSIADPDFADVLIAVGQDPDAGVGVDYSTLEIGHLGHIYESLLSLRLAPAQRDVVYEAREDRYRPARPGETADVAAGSLMWSTNEGGRKSGGVYYTRTELVHHLVQHSVVPAFERHLDQVRRLAERDAAAAARHLLSFAVVDPACGSAHFLVEVVKVLADRTVGFLAEQPLPEITEAVARLRAGALVGSVVEDAVLIGRLVLKHCVYGVDVSTMGAEVAKLSLWLASFVPGLSLAYLDGNLKVGNSLIGVVRVESVGNGKYVAADWASSLRAAAVAAARAADIEDRNPDEVEESRRAGADAATAARAAAKVFNLWTAEAFGVKGARAEVDAWAGELVAGRRESRLQAAADAAAAEHRFLHWPVAFPRVFDREDMGFDAVVGNPPWNEVTIEELAFYALFAPGLRGLPDRDRGPATERLLSERPELKERLREAQEQAAQQRRYLAAGEYAPMAGDPDLYKYFCQRYGRLLREGGELGVVLPRSAFVADGSTGFRDWLFEKTTCHRLDFLLNTGRWAFDSEPRYTVGLVASEATRAEEDHRVRVAGVAASLEAWQRQAGSPGVPLPPAAYGPGRMVPLVRDQAEADLLARLRRGDPFPLGPGGRWRCFGVAELHETNDAVLWRGATEGAPLWKGESFDQYAPNGLEARVCPLSEAVLRKIRKPRPGGGSLVADVASVEDRRRAVLRELDRARVAFRDVTRATDSRTVRACLVPPRTLLTNTGPYLAFSVGDPADQAACLAVMNSLPLDWQARRFVETHLNFFVLEGLRLPPLDDATYETIARAAARLSCVDERFVDFAAEAGSEVGELEDSRRERLRIEIDARVARAWELTPEDLTVLFRDFTLDAMPAGYRTRLLERLAEL
ncbi:MAG TPA: hypothetical protein VF160_07195 [Candidatus Dormibacteraeota bacterium]